MSNAPTIYNYHGVTGEYMGESFADPDPLEPGNWLIPANAVFERPPSVEAGAAIVRQEDTWQSVEDNRGIVYSTNTGEPTQFKDFGPLPDGFTRKMRPSMSHLWKSGDWRLDKATEKSNQTAEALVKRDTLQARASAVITPIQYAVALGEATEKEKTLLESWMRYCVALNRIEQQTGFPDAVKWPSSPAEE